MTLGLILSFLFSWIAWLMFGGYSIGGVIVHDVCKASTDYLSPAGNAQLDIILPCPNEAVGRELQHDLDSGVWDAIEYTNAGFTSARRPSILGSCNLYCGSTTSHLRGIHHS